MAANLHPDDDLPIKNQSLDQESFRINPNPVPGSLDDRPRLRLKELYPNIDNYRTVPTASYIDPSSIKQEWESLWTKTWLYAGHICDLQKPGDWFRFEINHESVIVARNAKGNINAYSNACRHRGTRLATAEFGRGAKGFMCPFHGWRYDMSGRNIRIVDRDTFAPETLCDVDLKQVRCEVAHGLVFVTFNPAAGSLREFLGGMSDVLESYAIDRMFIVKDVEYNMLSNWKTALDAFQEAYHTQTTHREFKPMVEDYFIQFDFYANGHNRALTPHLKVSQRLRDRHTLNHFFVNALKEVGIDPEGFEGGPEAARVAVQKAKRQKDNKYGLDYSVFTDDQLTDDWNLTVFPNITFNAHPEGILLMRFRPHPTNVDLSFYDVQIFVPKLKDGVRPPAYMGVAPDVDISGKTRPDRVYFEGKDAHLLGPVLGADATNVPRAQQGMKSQGMNGFIRFAESERRIQQFHAERELYMSGRKVLATQS